MKKNIYYYSRRINYELLIGAIKRGRVDGKSLYLKKFVSSEEENKRFSVLTLCLKKRKVFRSLNGDLSLVEFEKSMTDKRNDIIIDIYAYLCKHPLWKMRAAVAIGLRKHKQKQKAIDLLGYLVNNQHFAVVHTAIQSLEAINSGVSRALLRQVSFKHKQFRIRQIARRAVERLTYGANKHRSIKHILPNLTERNRMKKMCHQKSRRTMLVINRNTYRYFFNWAHSKTLFSRDAPRPDDYIIDRGIQRLKFTTPRRTVRQTKQRKEAFSQHIFFKNAFPIRRIEPIMQVNVGEIYWAPSEPTDPKFTRPVLILNTYNNSKEGRILIVPLTSNLKLTSRVSMIVKIDGEKRESKIQLSNPRFIDKESLHSKFGELEPEELTQALSKVSAVNLSMQFCARATRSLRYRSFTVRKRCPKRVEYLDCNELGRS